jgi:hypothetical protein
MAFTGQIPFKEGYSETKIRILDETVVSASRQSMATYCICDDGGVSRHWWNTCRTPTVQSRLTSCDSWEILMLKHELQGQKFSTDTEVKQATATNLCKTSGNALLHVPEQWVGCCKNCIACEGHHCEKETMPKPHKSSDSEQCEYSHYVSNFPHNILSGELHSFSGFSVRTD